MEFLEILLIVVIVLLVVAALGAVASAFAWRRGRSDEIGSDNSTIQEAIGAAVADAIERVREQAVAERDAAVAAALQQSAVLQRAQLEATVEQHTASLQSAAGQVKEQTTAELSSKKDLIDSRLDQFQGDMRSELARVAEMLSALNDTNARRFGEVETSLRAHAQITATLSESTEALRSAIANPQARGQWGERMAEDVLRLAGFVENVNYVKQTQISGGTGRPDYTFPMPKDHALYMDVKFPMASYLRYLEADNDTDREAHLRRFLSDVRARVKELARREYGSDGSAASVDYVLLFIPNEQLTGFIHEHDPDLLDHAMRQQVVMCSPLTLFAFLGIIRQAFDNFMIEQTSDEILQLIGTFGTQWAKYTEQVALVQRRFASVDKAFDQLATTRRRAVERPLRELDALRRQRNLPIDAALVSLPDDSDLLDEPAEHTGSDDLDESDDLTPFDGSVRPVGG